MTIFECACLGREGVFAEILREGDNERDMENSIWIQPTSRQNKNTINVYLALSNGDTDNLLTSENRSSLKNSS